MAKKNAFSSGGGGAALPQRVLITAGASGIGLAMAAAFLERGDIVAIADIHRARLRDAQKKYPRLAAFTADAADISAMRRVFAALEKSGGIDIVCANAGVAGPTATLENITPRAWRECLRVNLDGAFIAAKLAAPLMKARLRGALIFTSSTAGLFGYPLRAPYCAAKWGVIGLAKTLAMELGAFNIRANALCPGAVDGDRMDGVIAREAAARGVSKARMRKIYAECASLKTFIAAEDIAQAALFLTSPAGCRISGQALAIDGHTEKISA
jgi:NAD(P)-dependent dehydrogenase (short-subunit alcohol dehydrogenase family)